MTVIGRPLRRWRKQLEIFPEDVASTLGPVMQRLEPTLSAFSLPRDAEQGEVDGYDGIARRGSYERLLPSEWLLRESVPLEFLRRATQAEHSFFQLVRREASPTRASLMLFEAGPDQLGACRIAQLALLLLFAHHAELRGETLNWQHLHRIEEPPLHTLDEHTVRAFLDGRTARRPAANDIERVRQFFPRHELWLIGSRRWLAAPNLGDTAVSIHERVARNAQHLDVRFSAPGRQPREQALDLPEPAQAARLLRNPFESARVARAPVAMPAIRSNLLLNPSASRLYYLNERGQLIALAVPNSAVPHAGTARNYQSNNAGSIIAVEGGSGKQQWLCVEGDQLTLRSNGKGPPLLATARTQIPQRSPALWPLLWFEGERMATFVAPDRCLWRIDFGTGRAHPFAVGVRAVLNTKPEPLVAVEASMEAGASDGPLVLAIEPFRSRVVMRSSVPWHSVSLAASSLPEKWLLGFEEQPGKLQIVRRLRRDEPPGRYAEERILHPPSGESVVSVSDIGGELGFFSLDAARRTLTRFTRNSEKRIFQFNSPVVDLTCANGAFGFVTESRELGVVQHTGKHRLQRQLATP